MNDDGIAKLEKAADELMALAENYPNASTKLAVISAATAIYRHVIECERAARAARAAEAAPPWSR